MRLDGMFCMESPLGAVSVQGHNGQECGHVFTMSEVGLMHMWPPHSRQQLLPLQCKKWKFICSMADQHGGNQCHGRKFPVRRWEQQLYRFFASKGWEEVA